MTFIGFFPSYSKHLLSTSVETITHHKKYPFFPRDSLSHDKSRYLSPPNGNIVRNLFKLFFDNCQHRITTQLTLISHAIYANFLHPIHFLLHFMHVCIVYTCVSTETVPSASLNIWFQGRSSCLMSFLI